MKGPEFMRRIRRRGKRTGILVRFESRHGKGSHGRLYYGPRMTTLKDRNKEIGPGLLRKMLRDLGLTQEDID
jgi:predicted RNA binding protein YcfA (HicA-like mRNA interferase family)